MVTRLAPNPEQIFPPENFRLNVNIILISQDQQWKQLLKSRKQLKWLWVLRYILIKYLYLPKHIFQRIYILLWLIVASRVKRRII